MKKYELLKDDTYDMEKRMTWHLKDRELEEALNKKSHPNHTFTDRLNEVMAKITKKDFSVVVGCVVKFQRIGTGGVIHENNIIEFSIEEIENVPDYNPNDWNSYPEVTPPPTQEFMRVEVINSDYGREATYLYKAQFKNGLWVFNEYIINIKEGDRVRFRPWED